MAQPVIKVENLSKQYRLGTLGSTTLTDDLKRMWATMRGKDDPFLIIGETNDRSSFSKSQYVWALRDINFEVQQGDVVGLVGKNGAGKSTLLKILSKVTSPSKGSAKLKGRIASMLEVGTGFHPELTGRENVYLNGTIMGMTKTEVASKMDAIVDFAGVARYLETPVKRYSSGMTMRLAFAVAAHLEPEILLVDEVLAVGDSEFQKKCLGKMGEVSKEGRTILFVSHNLGAMRRLCNKGLLLKHGEQHFFGGIEASLERYLGGSDAADSDAGNRVTFPRKEDGLVNVLEISVENDRNESRSTYFYGDQIFINIKYALYIDTRNLGVCITVARNGEILFLSQDTDYDDDFATKKVAGDYQARVALPDFLKAGIYTITIVINELGKPKEEKIDVIQFVLDDTNADTSGKSYAADKPGMLKPNLPWAYIDFPVTV